MVTIQAQNRNETEWTDFTSLPTESKLQMFTQLGLKLHRLRQGYPIWSRSRSRSRKSDRSCEKVWYKNWKTFAVVLFLYDDDERRQRATCANFGFGKQPRLPMPVRPHRQCRADKYKIFGGNFLARRLQVFPPTKIDFYLWVAVKYCRAIDTNVSQTASPLTLTAFDSVWV